MLLKFSGLRSVGAALVLCGFCAHSFPAESGNLDCVKAFAAIGKDALHSRTAAIGMSPATESLRDFVSSVNGSSNAARVVGITAHTDENKRYFVLQHGGAEERFVSSQIGALVDRLEALSGPDHTLFWIPEGFTEDKKAAFEATLRSQWARRTGQSTSLRTLEIELDGDAAGVASRLRAAMPRALFEKGLVVDRVHDPELITEGSRSGWTRVVVDLSRRIQNKVVSFSLTIFAKSKKVATDLYAAAKNAMLSKPGDTPADAGALVAFMMTEAARQNPSLKPSQIRALLRDEFGSSYLVLNNEVQHRFAAT